MRTACLLLSVFSVLFASPAPPAGAQTLLAPGQVFRDYVWRPAEKWQRCTGPDATEAGAKAFLPNPINKISIDDLTGAKAVAVIVEMLTSHAGTRFPRLRIGSGPWHMIPESTAIPGKWGRGPPTYMYLAMRSVAVPVPLAQIALGENTFEFTCQGAGGQGLGLVWPQFLVYGVTFRVFYDESKPHPTGHITRPVRAAELSDNPTFEAQASGPNAIARVDYIGNYDDFDWRGEGDDTLWRLHYRYGQLAQHIGGATAAPYRVHWDTSWIPTQPGAFRVIARITDATGLSWITPAVEGLTLRRNRTVARYRSYQLPYNWHSNLGAIHECRTDVTHDLSKATSARLYMTTWNGRMASRIMLNWVTVAPNIGANHDLSYDALDVSLGHVQSGMNALLTQATTEHHGIEVQWPGIELWVRYDIPETRAHYVTYGRGCNGTGGLTTLAATGRPVGGQTLTIHLDNAKALTPAVLIHGESNTMFGAFALPFDFASGGAPGCFLWSSMFLADARLSSEAGKIAVVLPLPVDAKLVGLGFFSQWIVFDPAANELGFVFSNGGRMIYGLQ